MSNDIPRRLRRFQRKQQPVPQRDGEIDFGNAVQAGNLKRKEELNKQITMQLALGEVQRFKERHKRLPKKKEYDKIAESIYKQLKDEDKRKKLLERHEKGRKPKERKGRPGKGRGKQSKLKEDAFAQLKNAAQGLESKSAGAKSAVAKELEGMSVEDLFGEGKTAKKKAASSEDFSLDDMSSLDSAPEEDSKADERGGCPNCGNQTEDVIFCPECGTAFCEKCAKRVEKIGTAKKVVCPNCGKKVNH